MKRATATTTVLVALVCAGIRPVFGQSATTITITDKVVVGDCQRFGINLGGSGAE